ncbi:MAG: hypothetical protein ACXVH7_06075 [Thermoanaerobaculia bacterium]
MVKNAAVLQTITDAIAPFIGTMMARSSVEVHCKRLGIDGDRTVTGQQINDLLRELALGLNIFLGRTKAEALIQDIRAAIGGK